MMTTSGLRLAAVLTAALALGACSEIRFLSQAAKTARSTGSEQQVSPDGAPPEYGAYKVGNPYQIDGAWYYPQVDFQYEETGVASWYGPQFHGRATANGAVFDMNRVSAAHRTLPIPSYVRVTNLDNGRSLEVLVNDRGPFAKGRIIDLSRRAAQLLGFETQGTALVRVEILADRSRYAQALARGERPDTALAATETQPDAAPVVSVTSIGTPQPSAAPARTPVATVESPAPAPVVADAGEPSVQMASVGTPPTIFVQAGAFSQMENAQRAKALLSSVGPVEMSQVSTSAAPMFRVRVGPVASVDEADALLRAIGNAGFPDARIVVVQ